jgi:hypothetical protein
MDEQPSSSGGGGARYASMQESFRLTLKQALKAPTPEVRARVLCAAVLQLPSVVALARPPPAAGNGADARNTRSSP